MTPCPTPNPTHFPFLFLFLFSFFPSVFPQPRANPTPFVMPQLNSRVSKKKEKKKEDILRSNTCDPTYPTPHNHTFHKNPHSLGRPLICFFPGFFFFFPYNKHSSLSLSHFLPQYPLHSTTSTIIFRQGSLENYIEKK